MKKVILILTLLLVMVPAMTFGATKTAPSFQFTPTKQKINQINLMSTMATKNNAKTKSRIKQILTNGVASVHVEASNFERKGKNGQSLSASMVENSGISAFKFVPKQSGQKPDIAKILNTGNVIHLTDLDTASPKKFGASFQDIPDLGYVRILGVGSLESFDVSPPISGYDSVWCQSPDRSSGIRILQHGDIWEGDLFFLEGYMSTTEAGERVIIPLEIYPVDHGFPLPRPMFVNHKGLSTGLTPKGLMMKIAGRVLDDPTFNDPDATTFYIEDGSGVRDSDSTPISVKVVDSCYGYNPPVQKGDFITITGTLSWEMDESGKKVPVFYRSTDGSNTPPYTGSTKYTISGTVTADADATGQTVWIGCDGGSTTAIFDPTGVATYTLKLREGDYSIYARLPGYGSDMWWVTVDNDCTGIDYTITPMEQKMLLELVIEKNIIKHDGISTTKGYILCRDPEAKLYSDKNITLTTTAGQIVSCDTMTDSKGRINFVLKSSVNAETALIEAKCEEIQTSALVFFVNSDDPIAWPDEIWSGKTVSGNVPVKFYAIDMSLPETATIEDQMDKLYEYTFEVDGQEIDGGIPIPVDDDPDYGSIPVVYTVLRTNDLPNGPHTIRAKITNSIGKTFYSLPQSFISDNEISNLKMTSSSASFPDEVDLLGGGTVNITATLKEPTSVKVTAYEHNPTLTPSLCNGKEIANGTFSSLNCAWNGKIFPSNGLNQPDQVYIEITNSVQSTGEGVGRWYGVRMVADENADVLVFAGKYTHPNDLPLEALTDWPIRTYTMYRRAKDKGMTAIRLNPAQANWTRLKRIIGNGRCRIIYGFCHGFCNVPPTQTGVPSAIGITSLWLTGGHVTSIPSGMWWGTQGSFEELGLRYSNRIQFCQFDSCLSGRRGGNIINPFSTAPDVPYHGPANKNDMADVLGMYYDSDTPATYVGWHGFGGGGLGTTPDWSSFIAGMNYPFGFHELWTRGGWEVSRVVGRYPYGGIATPFVLTQPDGPNAPGSWYDIQQNLRCFGAGLLGENQGYYETYFH